MKIFLTTDSRILVFVIIERIFVMLKNNWHETPLIFFIVDKVYVFYFVKCYVKVFLNYRFFELCHGEILLWNVKICIYFDCHPTKL